MKKHLQMMLLLLALFVPWVTQGQAKVSEYDGEASTAAYSTIVGTTGANSWGSAGQTAGYVEISMPFPMQFGEQSIADGSTLRVYGNGYAKFQSLSGSLLAPLYSPDGYNVTASSVYTKSTPSMVAVEWRKVTSGNNSYSFQLKLYSTGEIEFCYGPMTINSSIYVFAGLESSDQDVFSTRGENSPYDWNSLGRSTSYQVRSISPSDHPIYNATTNQGVVYTFTQPACVKPTGLTAVLNGEDDFELQWTSDATSFQIKYSNNPDFDPSIEGLSAVSSTTSKTISTASLSPVTDYYFYVRTMCGSTPSGWVGPVSVRTPCGAPVVDATHSFFEGFESGYTDQATVANCWLQLSESGSYFWLVNSPATTNYNRSARTGSYSASLRWSNTRWLFYRFHLTAGTSYDFSMFARQDGTGTSNANVTVMYGAEPTTAGMTNSIVAATGLNNVYQEIAGSFVPETTGDYYIGIKGYINSSPYYITIDDITLSVSPTCPKPAMPTATEEGLISWTASFNATSYDLRYGLAGFNPASAGTAVNNISGTSRQLTDLESNTDYDVYLRAHCSATSEVTEWVGPVSFHTPCPTSCQLTLNLSDAFGDGWNGNAINLYQDGVFVNSYTIDDGASANYNITLCGGSMYSLMWQSGSYSDECTMVISHNGSVIYSGGAPSGTFASFRACPTCADPSDIAGTSPITWTPGDATQWQVRWAEQGSTDYTSAIVTEPTYTSSAWASNTDYTIQIRSICGADDTNSWVSYDFTTPCMPLDLPFSEGFESYQGTAYNATNGVAPNCWDVESSNTRLPHVTTAASYVFAHNGTKALSFYGSGTQYAALPAFSTPVNGQQIGFWYRFENASYGTLTLGYITAEDEDFNSFTAIATIPGHAGSMTYYERALNDVSADAARLVFKWYSSSQYDVSIDDIEIIALPTCFKPTNLAATPVSTESAVYATLSWDENSPTPATQWEVRYWKAGSTDIFSVIANDNTYQLQYLEQGVNYAWQVRGLCSADDQSDWSDVNEFKQNCVSGGDVVIGEGTISQQGLPSKPYNNYSLSEQIFTASEMGGAKNLTSVSFNVSLADATTRRVDVYLGETDKTEFSSATDWVPVTGMTKVVNGGSLDCTTTGWKTMEFNTPFAYTGNNNLIIVVDDNTGSWKAINFYATATTGNKSIFVASDNTNYDPTSPTSYSGTRSSNRSNIKFGSPCELGSCPAPQVAIAVSEADYEATLTFTDPNDSESPVFGYKYGVSGFDPESATGNTTTTTTATITGLAPLTSYDLYVYSVCESTPGNMVRYSFTTPFIPNCKEQQNFAVNNLTYNTATVTWEQKKPDQVPEFWTVRYANADFDPATAATSDYTEQTIPGEDGATLNLSGLVAGNTYYIYVKATCDIAQGDISPNWSSYSFFTPACYTPTQVVASEVTNSTALISWQENGSANAWTLKYGLQGFDPETEGTAVTSDDETSVELTGLDAYAYYDVFVKSNCTATDESEWSQACSFRTACPEQLETTVDGTETYTMVSGTNPDLHLTQHGAIIYDDGGPDGDYSSSQNQTLVIYPATEGNSVHLQGEYSTEGSTWDYAIIYNGVGTSGSQLGEMRGEDGTLDVTSTDATGALTIWFKSDNGVTKWGWALNATEIAPCNTDATCFAPASVSTEVTTSNEVTVSWNHRTDLRPIVKNFELIYGLKGFNPDQTESGVLVSGLNDTHSYKITDALAASKEYDVYVRTVCGNDDHSAWTKASFTTYPTCWAPVDLTATPNENSVILSWQNNEDAPSAATLWEVVYGLKGFGDPEYNGTHVEANDNTAFTIEGLKHSSLYEFYVRALCGNNDKSAWCGPVTKATSCGVWNYDDMPLVENFDGYTAPTSISSSNHPMPNCWSVINGGSSNGYYPSIYSNTSYAHSGTNSLYFYRYNSTSSSYKDQYAVLPQFDFDLDTLEISFYAQFGNTYSAIEVGAMTNPTDATTFDPVQTVSAPSTGYNTQQLYEVSFSEYEGEARYVAFRAAKPQGGSYNYNTIYLDDLTVKLREKVKTLPDENSEVTVCNEFVMPDTATMNHGYHGNLNATYVIRPAQPGYVAHITGNYDLENGYDFIKLYRGAVNANNLIGSYTGTGYIDFVTNSELWKDSGFVSLVFTTDEDNAFANTGFKLLVSCEQPKANPTPIEDVIVENGTYTWTAGNGLTYTNHSTFAMAPDRPEDITFPVKNVAGFDSVYRHLVLTLHPTYELTTNKTICDRESVEFYGNTYTTSGTHRVPLQSEYGADSIGVLILKVDPAPFAMIYYNNEEVESIDAACDNQPLALEARSDINNATYLWSDESTEIAHTVYPHISNVYSLVATNPATGCTSLPATVTVNTTPVPALSIAGDDEICYGQSTTLSVSDENALDAKYVWKNGNTTIGTGNTVTVNPTETTIYTVTATTNNASACAVSADFTVTVNPLPVIATPTLSVNELCLNQSVTLKAEEKEGLSYLWNTGATTAEASFVPTASGAFTVTVTDLKGCENSFTTPLLTVHPSYDLSEDRSACVGMLPYIWGDMTLTEAGNYNQTFHTATYGCDSLVHLTFVVEDTAVYNSNRELCQGVQFTFGEGIYEQTYTANESTVISYLDTTSGECPARYNLNLTVNTHNPATVEQTVCDTYTWPLNNETYTVSGEYQTTLQTVKGCDSVVTLNLTVNYQNTGVELVESVCDQYTWDLNGETYTAPTNEPTVTIKNQFECDSVVTLNLVEVKHSTTGVDNIIYCASTEYTWMNGRTYRLSETSGNAKYTLPDVRNAQGCDSILVLNLTMNYVLDTLNWKDTVACDEFIIDTVACDNTVNTAYIRESGDYQLRIHGDNGGDVIARYHLSVQSSSHHTNVVEACVPYSWKVKNAKGVDTTIAVITAEMVNDAPVYNMSVNMAELGFVASSCSNIEVLRLTPLYPTYDTTDTVVICKDSSWEAPNHTIFSGETTTTGVYTWDATGSNPAGCKLYKQVDLTVNPTYTQTVNLTLCENQFENGSFTYQAENRSENEVELTILGPLNGQPYSNSVITTWTASTGCDSVMTFNYTVNPILRDTTEVATCYKYTWDANGVTYDQPGDTVDSVKIRSAKTGCDSISYLKLTISDTIHTYKDTNVCTNYEYKGETYVETKTFVESYTAESGCDSLLHITFVVHQNVLNEQFVYANRPYTWEDGKVYDASTQNVFYKVPVVEGCDSILKLTFTMGQPVSICEGQLPYTVQIGNTSFVITDAVSGEWTNEDALGNDTIVAYTILRNASYELSETACDSYLWHGTNYTTSGDYEFDTIAANGCDSTATLHLTINNGSHNVFAQTACDSYTWHDTLRTVSGDYTYSYTNEASCASVDTLHLTINKNNGVEETLTTCDSLSWHGQKLTLSDTYTHPFVDMNGCTGDSVLNLTVNNTVYQSADSLVNAASTIYRGVLYTAPTDIIINDTVALGAANGCDSITAMHLRVELGGIITEDTVYCGDFTWRDGNTYTWIPMSERTNPAINYKNRATGVPVSEFPTYAIYDEEGVVLSTYVLKLTLQEAHTEYKDVTVLLGDNTYTDPTNGHSFDFTAEKAAKRDTTVYDTLHFRSDYYCDSIVYYTFNLVYNYDTIYDTVCAEQTEYVFNGHTYSLGAGASSQTSTVFSCGFEESDDIAWKLVDADQDGYNWTINPLELDPHTGTGYIASESYINAQWKSLDPDNWLISPAIILPDGSSTLSWFCKSQDPGWLDSYSVYISTTGDETTDFTTELFSDTPGGEYVERTADLSTYAGQTVYIAFRHHDSEDNYILLLDDISITSDQVSDFTFTDTVGTGDNRVVTILNVNKRPAVTGTETIAACDSTRWNNTLYTESVVNEQVTLTGAAANGCDSIVTLNITITPTIHNVTEETVCDSYVWHDNTYTASTTDIFTYPNVSDPQCSNVDTLKLVVKNSTTGTDVQTACDTYTWIDGNIYTASNNTATYTLTNADGCDSVVTLNLTIYNSYEGPGNDIDTLGASISLTDINGTYLFLAPYDNDTTLSYQTVAGCDSIVTIHIKVSQYEVSTENQIACGIYTWNRTNHTYKWISNDEKEANAIVIPGASSMLPLYKDTTANAYIYTRPTDTVGNQVYELNLNLNEAAFEDSTIARFPQSMNVLSVNNTNFDFSGMTSASNPTADTVVTLTLPHASLCGTVKTYNVHVVYNYSTDDTTVCFTNEYTWEDGTTSSVIVGSNNITKTLFEGDMENEVVVTRTITVRAANNLASETKSVCDSIVWNNQTYTTGGEYTYPSTDQFGCDSITTLYLTVNNTARADDPITSCDSAQWNGTWYYESGSAYDTTIAANGCDSITTLLLTINVNNTGVDTTVTECEEFTWDLTSRTYTASDNDITCRTQDENGCYTTNHLHLTINKTSSQGSVLWVTDGSYRYIAQDGTTTLILSGQTRNFTEHYTNAAGCDSTLNITINVGEGYFAVDDTTVCNSYTWRDGNTYVWISAEERAAHNNALFKNQTGAYVTSNPIWRVANEGDYDSIYMLRLNLTQNFEQEVTIDFPISLGTLTYGDSTFYFSMTEDEAREFVNTVAEREVHFHSDYYCDSVHYLHINLNNNYNQVADTDICVTATTFEWRGHTIDVATEDYDHARILYLYDTVGTAENPVVEYIKITQHPVVYATERRTACDSYTWNGTTYTESTSNATFTTVDQFGCDSTVTLLLTIYKSTDSVATETACGSFSWNGNTYTESTDVTVLNLINRAGCDSTATLHLTINNGSHNAFAQTACDSYTWHDTLRTVSGDYTYSYTNEVGCPSVDTLHLTINHSSSSDTTVSACDSYTWNGETHTISDDYVYQTTNAAGCDSTATLHLTINASHHGSTTQTVCDSTRWFATLYTQSGVFVHPDVTAEGCENIDTLHLTVNYSTHEAFSDTACNSYTWSRNGQDYTTSGTYTYSYTNEAGCSSTDTLHLVVNYGTHYDVMEVFDHCGPFTWVVNNDTVATYSENIETSTQFVSPITKCDSVLFLKLTIINNYVFTSADTVCEQTLPYIWTVGEDRMELTEAGDYQIAYTAINGCDSTYKFALSVNPTISVDLTDQVCLGKGYEGYKFEIPAEELPEPGVYLFKHTDPSEITGCDSITTLTLTVGDILSNVEVAEACDTYTWEAKDEQSYTYTETGIYFTEPYTNAMGCLSVDTLHLTINKSYKADETVSACNSYTWNDSTYTASGDYTYSDTTIAGCDSIVVLHLTVNYSTFNAFVETACDSFSWNGETYTSNGDYTYEYTNEAGCASVDTLHLTIKHSSHDVFAETVCDSYTWSRTGETYTTSGDKTYEYTNVEGCTSVDTLHLTILNKVETSFDATTCYGSIYIWNGGAYTTAGTYQQVFEAANGCDSIVTLHLTISDQIVTNISETSCGAYTWNEATYTTSGVYTQTFTSASGCDSVVNLTLVVNNPTSSTTYETACDSYTWNDVTYTTSGIYSISTTGANGCDSVATLILTINNSTHNVFVETACDSYTWNGTEYTTSGDKTYEYTNAAGCLSVDTLHLTINNKVETSFDATTCYGTSYIWNGQAYATAGAHQQTLTAANGCDSIVTLNLTIGDQIVTNINETSCGAFTWNERTYTTSGVYTQTFSSASGCDSVVNLTLVVNNPTSSTTYETACDSYTWNGETYTTSGIYSISTTGSNGCDSVATLILTINNASHNAFVETACDSYTWNGQTYTVNGDYTYAYTNVAGCPSVDTLHLTINNGTHNEFTETACDSYTWNGVVYTTSGDKTFAYINVAGCPSVDTLHLTINNSAHNTITESACDSYTWNDQTYTVSGIYNDTTIAANGCDSVVTLFLTINNSVSDEVTEVACDSYTWSRTGETYTVSGDYTDTVIGANGCNNVLTLHLTINNGTLNEFTEVACDSYTWSRTGETYTATGDYTYNYTNADGCASSDVLHLTVNYNTSSFVSGTACNEYTWNGQTYTVSGVYTYSYTTAAGCASVDTLDLTINYSSYNAYTEQASGSYTWNGETYTESGDYTYDYVNADGCASVDTLHLTILGIDVPEIVNYEGRALMVNHYPNGATEYVEYLDYRWFCDGVLVAEGADNYMPANGLLNGCYYVEVPTDESRTAWGRSNTLCFQNGILIGIEEADDIEFSFTVAPNPVRKGGVMTVSTELPVDQLKGATLTVYDLNGREVITETMEQQSISVVANLASGIYTIKLTTLNGDKAVKKVVVR